MGVTIGGCPSLIAAFIRYYVGQWFLDTRFGGEPEADSYMDLDAE